jgi:ketosteroid isomerase-like protein
MKRFLISLGLLASFGSAVAAGQAAPNGRGGAVVTPTRNILTFTKLENDWFDAIQRHDAQAIGRYVTDDFEIRSAPVPGVPTAREEALRQWTQMPAAQASIRQMAVHEYGDLMLVSFLWTLGEGDAAQGAQQAFFVVDTWKRVGTDWKVAVRYAAPVSEGGASVPGTVPPSAQPLRKKP